MELYGWKIYYDTLDDKEVEIYGGSMSKEQIEHAQYKKEFKMYDDDETLYFRGYMSYTNHDQLGSDLEFTPLDDFGMPDSGCTEIKYLEKGEWRTL